MKKETLPLVLTESEELIKDIEELHPYITQAFQLKDTLISIEVSSKDSFEIASSKATEAKKLIKEIDAKRKLMTAPLDKEKKTIIDLIKKIINPIKDGIDELSAKITKFAEEEEKRKKEEVKVLEEKRSDLDEVKEKLNKLEIKIYNSIDKYNTVEELNDMFQKAIKNKQGTGALETIEKSSDSKDIKEQVVLILKRVKRYGAMKVSIITKKENFYMVKERKILESEMLNTPLITKNEESVEISTKIAAANSNTTSNIRKTIKFDLIDIDKVDSKYTKTIIDEDVIKMFIKNISDKKSFMDLIEKSPEKIINGLKFRVERTHVGR